MARGARSSGSTGSSLGPSRKLPSRGVRSSDRHSPDANGEVLRHHRRMRSSLLTFLAASLLSLAAAWADRAGAAAAVPAADRVIDETLAGPHAREADRHA